MHLWNVGNIAHIHAVWQPKNRINNKNVNAVLIYCHAWGVPWLIKRVLDWMIVFSDTSLQLQLWQLTINGCLRLAPFLTGPRVSSLHYDEWRTKNHLLYVTTDGQWASLSWNKAPIWGSRPDFYYFQTVAGLLMLGALTRGPVCRLQLLLALASALVPGFESRGTRDHILLSQIRGFPFRRLLRLTGSRWRYSTPPFTCERTELTLL
jgi:hypothetical protein